MAAAGRRELANALATVADKHCTVRVVLAASPPVVVEIADVDPIPAVSRTVERAARYVGDGLKRPRDLQRLDRRERYR